MRHKDISEIQEEQADKISLPDNQLCKLQQFQIYLKTIKTLAEEARKRRQLLPEFDFARFLGNSVKDGFKENVKSILSGILSDKVVWKANTKREETDWYTSSRYLDTMAGSFFFNSLLDKANIIKAYQKLAEKNNSFPPLSDNLIHWGSIESYKEFNAILSSLAEREDKIGLFQEAIHDKNTEFIDSLIAREVWSHGYLYGIKHHYENEEKRFWPFKYIWESRMKKKDEEIKEYLLGINELEAYLGHIDKFTSVDLKELKPDMFFNSELGQLWIRNITQRYLLIQVYGDLLNEGYAANDKRFNDRLLGMDVEGCQKIINACLEKSLVASNNCLDTILKDIDKRILPIEYGEFRS